MEVVLVMVMTVIVKVTVLEFKVAAKLGCNHNDVGNGEDNDVNNSKAPKGCQS